MIMWAGVIALLGCAFVFACARELARLWQEEESDSDEDEQEVRVPRRHGSFRTGSASNGVARRLRSRGNSNSNPSSSSSQPLANQARSSAAAIGRKDYSDEFGVDNGVTTSTQPKSTQRKKKKPKKPQPWSKVYDEGSGYYYFYNNDTQESSWEQPPGYQDPSHDDASDEKESSSEGEASATDAASESKGVDASVGSASQPTPSSGASAGAGAGAGAGNDDGQAATSTEGGTGRRRKSSAPGKSAMVRDVSSSQQQPTAAADSADKVASHPPRGEWDVDVDAATVLRDRVMFPLLIESTPLRNVTPFQEVPPYLFTVQRAAWWSSVVQKAAAEAADGAGAGGVRNVAQDWGVVVSAVLHDTDGHGVAESKREAGEDGGACVVGVDSTDRDGTAAGEDPEEHKGVESGGGGGSAGAEGTPEAGNGVTDGGGSGDVSDFADLVTTAKLFARREHALVQRLRQHDTWVQGWVKKSTTGLEAFHVGALQELQAEEAELNRQRDELDAEVEAHTQSLVRGGGVCSTFVCRVVCRVPFACCVFLSDVAAGSRDWVGWMCRGLDGLWEQKKLQAARDAYDAKVAEDKAALEADMKKNPRRYAQMAAAGNLPEEPEPNPYPAQIEELHRDLKGFVDRVVKVGLLCVWGSSCLCAGVCFCCGVVGQSAVLGAHCWSDMWGVCGVAITLVFFAGLVRLVWFMSLPFPSLPFPSLPFPSLPFPA